MNYKLIFQFCMFLLCLQSCILFAFDGVLESYIPAADRPRTIRHDYYALCFDFQRNTPRWVLWRITPERMLMPACHRAGMHFVADSAAYPPPSNYAGSGYDLGHLCPAEDMRFDFDAMKSTFVISNAVPQTPRLNRGTWKSLESQCRRRALAGHELILLAGPLYLAIPPPTIGRDRVAVPSHCWKLVIDRTDGTVAGYVFPNTATVTGVPAMFRKAPEEVRQAAGL